MGRWSKSLYISSLQYTPFEFLFEKCRGSFLKKVSPESLKLNILFNTYQIVKERVLQKPD